MVEIELGWSLHKRLELLVPLQTDPNAKVYDTEIEFTERKIQLPVIRIPIGLPKYRLINGRTSSLQLEWLSQNPDKPNDFFTADIEKEELQEIQHQLLRQLINEKDLLPYFEKTEHKQTGYLILDNNGFVLNGNRRLCTWRELLKLNSQLYSHFEYINVIVLPPSDSKAIDKLEGVLQVEKDIRADYSWHALANMFLARMKLHGLNEKNLAEIYDLTESEVKKYLEMRNYAEEYLKSRDMEGKWSELEDKYAFEQLVNKRKQFGTTGEKRLFEVQAFALIDDPSGGRLYQSIPDLYKYSSELKEKLLEKFPIELDAVSDNDLLGSDPEEESNLILATVIDKKENRKTALEIIKDTLETLEFLKKGENTSKYVFKQLQKANSSVQSALAATKHKESLKDGVSETIISIEKCLSEIKAWLNNGKQV